jgi:hypothetical protein
MQAIPLLVGLLAVFGLQVLLFVVPLIDISRKAPVYLLAVLAVGIGAMITSAQTPKTSRRASSRWRARVPVRLGADGIALADRFIHYRETLTAETESGDLVVQMRERGAKPLVLAFTNELDRLHAAARCSARRDSTRGVALPEGPPAYRVCAIRRDDLLQIIEDAGADPSARIAACVRLSEDGAITNEERTALARTRARTAHPRVRVSIEEVEEGSAPSRSLDGAGARMRT